MRALSTLLVLVAAVAHAEAPDATARSEADRLMLEGNSLGERGKLAEAIARFRAADKLYPRAKTACNIGLCYARLKAWPQAWLSLSRCQAQLGAARPEWVDVRLGEATRNLREGPYVPVEVAVDPRDAQVTASPFGSDEPLPVPGIVWLPFGRQELTGSRAGFVTARETLDLDNRDPRAVRLVLSRQVQPAAAAPEPVTSSRPATAPSGTTRAAGSDVIAVAEPQVLRATSVRPRQDRSSLIAGATLFAVGAAALGGGLGANLAGSDVRARAAQTPAGTQYQGLVGQLAVDRAAAVTLYAVGGAMVVSGAIVLLWRAHRRHVAR